MDHYSLETLSKLHHRELVQAGLQEQSVRRQSPAAHLSNRFRRRLLLISSLIAALYWLFT